MEWTTIISFRADGLPKGQPRVRRSASGGMYTPTTADGWRFMLHTAARQAGLPKTPAEGPMRLEVAVLMPRPQRLLGRKSPAGRIPFTSKPDFDNLLKTVADCLTNLGVWRDDAQVFSCDFSKWYVAAGEKPGAEVVVEEGFGGEGIGAEGIKAMGIEASSAEKSVQPRRRVGRVIG